MKDIRKITAEDEIDSVISENPDKLVILKFQSTWCGPCQALGRTLANLPDEMTENVVLLEADVDEAEELTEKYGIRNIPVMYFYKGDRSKELEKTVGLLTAQALLEKIGGYMK